MNVEITHTVDGVRRTQSVDPDSSKMGNAQLIRAVSQKRRSRSS